MININRYFGGISILGVLLLGVIIILVISYFKISIQAVVESPESQGNFSYVADSSRSVWNDYLKRPASYLWNDIFIDIFWQGFINNMKRIRDGMPTDFDNAAPTVNFQ
ncbi:hypothetical protein A3I95_00330 [Candidatus Nomurabacteria bacterium RIFCSPLOWO2_02_FULL_44_12]|uniref:Uncharacterized protein n=1 Tax=Candidatus Nomurabacteria bacterium RIFCSPLOWO2_12_FULL_44_11 TaxID=1801796 RepID=A0A1F6Y5P2_9BACT|nr:MAG: hypothetical protein A3G53_00225 [Candidatus Nomurabacteria bacterium RIFCSPLOWO2_12_FULL_44_11]OGJ07879.1 MAG: hypothetical protein A3I95_00330 [Candidatus Nomurabacteria bacterium RIFCSPLOWO2_02_FULL_44_12]